MSCKILPHNFPELIEAQIAILKKQSFKLLPDFQTGGLMDAREYADGKGTIKVRAKIKEKDESTVVIKEIPPTSTTDSLIASIEDAARKGKIKVKSVNDFTAEDAEIEVKAPSGVSADQLIDALYAFTDCELSISSRIIVIRDNRPVEMTVTEVLKVTETDGSDATAVRRAGDSLCTVGEFEKMLFCAPGVPWVTVEAPHDAAAALSRAGLRSSSEGLGPGVVSGAVGQGATSSYVRLSTVTADAFLSVMISPPSLSWPGPPPATFHWRAPV
jgi:hypothetical protein